MQPVYLTGHSRPVNQVLHNFDGDLLFTCSDDGTVCMYETSQLVRIGVFHVKEAVRSIDITKDSKYLIVAATTVGIQIYDVATGKRLASVQVPGVNSKISILNYGESQVLCLYEFDKKSYIRIFNLHDCLTQTTPPVVHEVSTTQDVTFTNVVWGPKNESLIVCTNRGLVMSYDIGLGAFIKEETVHRGEILSLCLTYDYTMLMTGSKDGFAKLLHPETFKTIREFHYGKPVRSATISPLFDNDKHQKFHMITAGGQDAKDVTTTDAAAGGFEMKLFSIIMGEKLAEIGGHFGPVHTTSFSPDGYAFASGAEDGYVHYHRFPPEYFSKKFE
jgi:translation initiation factor 3 subunit I